VNGSRKGGPSITQPLKKRRAIDRPSLRARKQAEKGGKSKKGEGIPLIKWEGGREGNTGRPKTRDASLPSIKGKDDTMGTERTPVTVVQNTFRTKEKIRPAQTLGRETARGS